jgi:hypothetical protein
MTPRWRKLMIAVPLVGLLALWYIAQGVRQLGSWVMDLGELIEAVVDHAFQALAENLNK